MKLVTIGTIYVDIKGYPFANYVPTGRNAGEVSYFHGGVARNIAEDVANLGEESIFVSLVDKSGVAIEVLNHLTQQGVNTSYIVPTEDGMGTWLAIFDDKGELSASISKRPLLRPIYDILAAHGEEIFTQADAILMEMDIEANVVAKTMELAAQFHVPVYGVISNITIAMERWSYIQQTACFICNRQEAGLAFGKAVSNLTPAQMLDILKQELPKQRLASMVVTMDKDGAVFANNEGEAGYIPPEKVQVVDTTGAGDSFFAGVSVGLSRGLSLEASCQMASKVAAQVISTKNNVYQK